MNHFIQKNKIRSGTKYLANESGFALAVVLMLMVVMAILMVAATQYASQDITRTRTYKQSRESFYVAEAGIQRAVNFFNYDGAGNSPGASANGFDDELDDIDHTVVLSSTGTRNGVSTTLEAVINRPTYDPTSAITTSGNLTGGGSFTVQGACGSIHTNSGFNQTGVSGTVTQGTTASGSCSGATCTASGAAEHPIPVVNPADFKSYAKYVLQNDGSILDQSTGNTYTKSGPNWSFFTPGDGNALFGDISQTGGGLWNMNGTDLADGIYYVEKDTDPTVFDGNIKVLNTPDPFQVTIIAEGYIDFGGNGDVVNYQGGPSPDIDELFLIAGTDLEFSGNPANQVEGMLYAGEQMSISGNVDINGFVISGNLADDQSLVSPESSIAGSLTVTYNCNGTTPFFSDHVTILSWQEQ